MERRGSGLKNQMGLLSCSELPYRGRTCVYFYADIFFVILYNLNYNVLIEKVSIEDEKFLFLMRSMIDNLDINKNTKEKVTLLFAQIDFDGIFGRTGIMDVTGISVTAAGKLISYLKNNELIVPINGYGKGKYKFIVPKE